MPLHFGRRRGIFGVDFIMKQVHPRSQTTAILYQEPTQAEMTAPKPSMGKGAILFCIAVITALTSYFLIK